jgi:hypothetical protein
VLVVGGLLNQTTPNTTSTTATQLYNPVANTWSAGKPAAQPRYNFALVVLEDGRVVMAGGSRDCDNVWSDASFVSEVELYNPKTASWQTIGNLPEPRAELAAVLLPGDKIWLAGGRTASIFWSSTWLIEAGNYRAQ